MYKHLTKSFHGFLKSINPDQAAVWGLPALLIPIGRYFFADPKESRAELLVRDASTYAVGAALFFLVNGATNRILKGKHRTLSVISGTLASIAFCVFGATRLAQLPKKQRLDLKSETSLPSQPLTKLPPSYQATPPTRYASRRPFTAINNPTFESKQVLRRATTYSIFSGSL